MRNLILTTAAAAILANPAVAQTNMSSSSQIYKDATAKGASSGRREQERATRQIPTADVRCNVAR